VVLPLVLLTASSKEHNRPVKHWNRACTLGIQPLYGKRGTRSGSKRMG